MKKTFRLIIAATAAITALASCAKDIATEEVLNPQTNDGQRVITIAYDAETKTSQDYDWHKVHFVEGDQIKVMDNSGTETCTIHITDGVASFSTSLTGNLTAVYPKECGYKSGRAQTITVATYPPHFQDGTLASGHIASAQIPAGSTKAVFHNETALLRIIPPAGTKQLTVTSLNDYINISDGEIVNGAISNEAKRSVVVGDGTKELGTCYVSIHPGAIIGALSFVAGVRTKSVSSNVVTEAGVAYTISGENWDDKRVLPGKFSVSAAGKQVQFSKGNLVATIDASGVPTAWKFAANQYDYLGGGGANKTIGTAAGDIDFFGWSTDAASNNWGIHTRMSTTTDYTYGDFVDWGKNIDDGSTWRTLSKDEWVYLFKTRSKASRLYKYGVTVCGKTNCVIIAPDNWDTSSNPLKTSYDATAWATAEAAGLVCLPAAGRRLGSDVSNVGGIGRYRSSTASDGNSAYFVRFDSSDVRPGSSGYRSDGYSVRLVTDVK